MSAMLFLVVLCLVLGYILYDSSKRNRKTQAPAEPASVFKKPNSYMVECQLLGAMMKEKTQQTNKKSLVKVSIHLSEFNEEAEIVVESIKRLSASMDFFLIINTSQPSTRLTQTLEQLVDKRKVFRCKTYEGQIALIRQLSSRIHIETDLNVIRSLKAYLNHIVTIQNVAQLEPALLKTSPNVISFATLTQAFSNLDKLKL